MFENLGFNVKTLLIVFCGLVFVRGILLMMGIYPENIPVIDDVVHFLSRILESISMGLSRKMSIS